MTTCPVCEGDGYTQDMDTGWGNAGPGDYDGPPAPEYSECEACHGTGRVDEDSADALTKQRDTEANFAEIIRGLNFTAVLSRGN